MVAKALRGSWRSAPRDRGRLAESSVLRGGVGPPEPVEEPDHLLGVGTTLGGNRRHAAAGGPEIPERRELRRRFSVDRAPAHHSRLRARQRVEPAPQRRRARGLPLREVGLLARIALEIVEFRRRRIDELPAVVANRSKRRPVHVQQRKVALGVRGRGVARGPTNERHQRPSVRIRQRRPIGEIQQRGRQIDPAHERRDPAAGREAPAPRDDHRDAERRFVDEHGVRVLAVLAEALAVIADDRDDRRRETAGTIQPVEHRSDHFIVERDLAVVEASGKRLAERRRRIVGVMRVVQVKPREERRGRAGVHVHPVERRGRRPVAAPLEPHAVVVRN